MSRALALALLGLVVLVDQQLPSVTSYLVLGLLDEPAHLATTVLLLLGLTAVSGRRSRGFVLAAVVSGNLIDLDHLPAMVGTDVWTQGTPRPYSHSLTFLVLLLTLSLADRPRRRIWAGASLGVSGHLLRDLATAPVALFWPADLTPLQIPHDVYLAVLAVTTICAVLPARHRKEVTSTTLQPRPPGAAAQAGPSSRLRS